MSNLCDKTNTIGSQIKETCVPYSSRNDSLEDGVSSSCGTNEEDMQVFLHISPSVLVVSIQCSLHEGSGPSLSDEEGCEERRNASVPMYSL